MLIESLVAAQRFGVEELIAKSLCETFSGKDFELVMDRFVSGTFMHAERREHEMANVVAFLKQYHLSFGMSEASREKLEHLSGADIRNCFENGVPSRWRDVVGRFTQCHTVNE